MFPALLAAVAAMAFSVLTGHALEAEQTKQSSGPAVSATPASGPASSLRRPRVSTSADRRRPSRLLSPAKLLVRAQPRLSSGSRARLPGSPFRFFEPDRERTGPAETTRCAASRSPSRRRPAAAAHFAAANRRWADRYVLCPDLQAGEGSHRASRRSSCGHRRLGRAPRRGRPADAHLAGLQLPGRRRRRTRGHLVRGHGEARRRLARPFRDRGVPLRFRGVRPAVPALAGLERADRWTTWRRPT